jgi:hypothetical protein
VPANQKKIQSGISKQMADLRKFANAKIVTLAAAAGPGPDSRQYYNSKWILCENKLLKLFIN